MAARHTQAGSPVHLGFMWVFDVRQSLFFVSYTGTISVIFGEIKCPHDVLMQTVTDLVGGTDSQCFTSDVETVE